jgi:hypothetical protein
MISKNIAVFTLGVAVLSILFAPSMASANLIGDDVTVDLVGADAGNGVNPQTATVVPGATGEFNWGDAGTCSSPDEGIELNIDDSEIWISVFDGTGFFVFCNSLGQSLSEPLTFIIDDLDWVQGTGSVTGINVQGNPAFPTNAQVIDGDTVQITINIPFGAVINIGVTDFHFDLEVDHAVAGEILPIDSTALFLAGMQSSALWLVPSLVGIAGVGFYLVRAKFN